MMHEEVVGDGARMAVTKAPLSFAEGLHRSNGFRSLLIQGYHALSLRFARWNAQPCCSIWVLVQTVYGQSANLIPPCATPSCNEQRCSLIWTLQGSYRFHETRQFGRWDVARHTLGHFRQIARSQQWSARHIFPSPRSGFTEEDRKTGKTTQFAPGRQGLTSSWHGHGLQCFGKSLHLLTRHFGKGFHLGIRLRQPVHKMP